MDHRHCTLSPCTDHCNTTAHHSTARRHHSRLRVRAFALLHPPSTWFVRAATPPTPPAHRRPRASLAPRRRAVERSRWRATTPLHAARSATHRNALSNRGGVQTRAGLGRAAHARTPLHCAARSLLCSPLQTDQSTGDPNLLKFLALGRLAKGSSGGAISQWTTSRIRGLGPQAHIRICAAPHRSVPHPHALTARPIAVLWPATWRRPCFPCPLRPAIAGRSRPQPAGQRGGGEARVGQAPGAGLRRRHQR